MEKNLVDSAIDLMKTLSLKNDAENETGTDNGNGFYSKTKPSLKTEPALKTEPDYPMKGRKWTEENKKKFARIMTENRFSSTAVGQKVLEESFPGRPPNSFRGIWSAMAAIYKVKYVAAMKKENDAEDGQKLKDAKERKKKNKKKERDDFGSASMVLPSSGRTGITPEGGLTIINPSYKRSSLKDGILNGEHAPNGIYFVETETFLSVTIPRFKEKLYKFETKVDCDSFELTAILVRHDAGVKSFTCKYVPKSGTFDKTRKPTASNNDDGSWTYISVNKTGDGLSCSMLID